MVLDKDLIWPAATYLSCDVIVFSGDNEGKTVYEVVGVVDSLYI